MSAIAETTVVVLIGLALFIVIGAAVAPGEGGS